MKRLILPVVFCLFSAPLWASLLQKGSELKKGENSKLFSEYMKGEELPIVSQQAVLSKKESESSIIRIILSIVLILLLGGISVFAIRFFKRKEFRSGTRKYLIEKVTFCPLGPKVGVSLLKVGKEFVLVGVTPSQVSFLSTLPKLQAQYEEEKKFDTGTFRAAVEEEVGRIKGGPNLNV